MVPEEKKEPRPSELMASGPMLDMRTAEMLFKPEDIARLKLTLLTGVHAAEKIEAIRKLIYAPVEKAEKGALFLSVLTDRDGSVRQEAALALRTLGVSADFAEALSQMSTGTAKQKALAASKLRAGTPDYTPAERAVALAFVASSLSYETDPEIRTLLVEMLTPLAGAAAEPSAPLAAILRAVVRAAAEDFARVAPHARSFFEALGTGGDLLWAEARTVEQLALRQFLMSSLLDMPMSDATRADVLAATAKEIATSNVDDLEFRTLRGAFIRSGDAALDAFLPLARVASGDRLQGCVSLLDGIAGNDRTTAKARAAIVEFFLDLWQRSERPVRMAIMETAALNHGDLPFETREAVARRLIDQLHAFTSGLGLDLAWTALRRQGPAAVAPLRSAVAESPYAEERDAAARLLGEIALRENLGDAVLLDLVTFMREMEKGDAIPTGLAVRLAGTLASRVSGPSPVIRDLYDDYRSRVGKVPYTSDVLIALCRLAAAPGAEPSLGGEMAMQILDVLNGELPAPAYEMKTGPEGREICIGGAYAVYTEFVPEILDGLAGLWTADRLPPHLRERMVVSLLKKFDDLVAYREVWAPANLLHLGEALVKIGEAPSSDAGLRRRIFTALTSAIRNTSIVRILGRLAGRDDDPSDDYAALMERLAAQLFKMFGMEEYHEAADRAAIVLALGRTAASPRIGIAEAKSRELRRRIIELIVEDKSLEARDRREVFSRLLASPAVPDALQQTLRSQHARVNFGARPR